MSPALLTPAWIEALDAAARGVAGDDGERFVIQQVVTEGAEDVTWHVVLAPSGVRVHPGVAEGADVTFRQDRATAEAIAAGELAAATALASGRLTVRGATAELTRHREVLARLDQAWAGIGNDA